MRLALLALLGPLAACDAVLGLEAPPADPDANVGPAAHPPYFVFRDDFETGDLRKWTKASRAAQPGTLDVITGGATGDVHAGAHALRATSEAGDVGFQYELLAWPQASPKADPLTSGTIAVRAWIRAHQLDRDTRELSIAEHDTSPTAYASAGFGATDPGPGYHWGFILSDPNTVNDTQASASDVADALGGWHCVEYIVNVAPAGHLAIFMDDQAVPLIEGDADTTVHTGWDSVTIGLGYASGSSASDVVIDDVAIALYTELDRGRHLGCHDR